ncbi:MAG: hypothetical protein ABJN36_20545 [Cyclobacteriaceae bacterium]
MTGVFATAQTQAISEDDLEFNFLKWHYAKYPKTTVSWESLGIGGEEFLRGTFDFEGFEMKVLYKTDGRVIQEEADLSKNVPVSLLHYLDDFYLKYKVLSFTRITDMQSDDISFKMEIKSKENGIEILEFDKNLIPVDSELVSGSN